MTATVALHGIFLWLSSALVVAVILAARALRHTPSDDVLGPCEQYERERVFR